MRPPPVRAPPSARLPSLTCCLPFSAPQTEWGIRSDYLLLSYLSIYLSILSEWGGGNHGSIRTGLVVAPSLGMFALGSVQSATWAPGNVTDHGRALTGDGRALLQHEFQRTGSFCLGGHLAPLTFLLGCQRCGTNSLYEGARRAPRGALCHNLQPLSHPRSCLR